MMRFVLILLLFANLAWAQGTPPAPAANGTSAEAEKKPAAPKSSSNPAVITINGVCSTPAPSLKDPDAASTAHKSADCKTVVTRSEFEQLSEMLQVPPAARKQFASQYATALIMSSEAHKRGLDHGPKYEQLLKLARLQVLTRQLAQSLQEESAKVSDQEIDTYYKNNTAAYQEASVQRVYIPRTQQQDPPKDKPSEADAKKRQEESAAAMKKEADDLRARAAAGEDFAKLQAEAYKFANFKATAPDVKMDKIRRNGVPPSQALIFDMKPGDVSQVISDASGFFVYKLESKETVPLTGVRDEIKSALQKQHMQDASQTMQQSATPSFDDAYFAASSPAPSRPPGLTPGSRPPAGDSTPGPK